MCASWVTTPTASRSDSQRRRRARRARRCAPRRRCTSYSRATSWRDRGLAGARRPDQRDQLAGLGAGTTRRAAPAALGAWSSTATDSSDASDTSSARRVAEVDVVELDRRRRRGGSVDRVRLVGDHRRQVEHLEDPVERHQRGHHVDLHVGQRGERAVEPAEVGGQRDERADRRACRRPRARRRRRRPARSPSAATRVSATKKIAAVHRLT